MATILYLIFVGWITGSYWFPLLEKWLNGVIFTTQELTFFIIIPPINIAVLWCFTKLEKKERIADIKKAVNEGIAQTLIEFGITKSNNQEFHMTKSDLKPSLTTQNVDDLTFYHTLMTRRHHGENIFWSRIQTLHVIQAAVLGGGYLLWRDNERGLGLGLSIALVFIGFLLTLMLGRLACNDWKDASVNDDKMKELGKQLGIERTAKRHCFLSHDILLFAVGLFLVIDIASILFLLIVDKMQV